jgi:hypothetical protein
MARLPRFQESGLISADIPRMDFANVREQSRQSQTISDALTRISEFAFGRAQQEQEQQNKIIGIQVRAELEGEVQKRFAELTTRVETGQLSSYNAIQEEVTAMRGLASGLAEVSPEQAQGLMQSIASSGKVLMNKSSDILIKAYQAQAQVGLDETLGALAKTMESVYEYVQDPEERAKMVSAARGKIYAQATQAPSLIPMALEKFEKVNRAAEQSAMAKYFSSADFGLNEAERLSRLDAGDAGKFTKDWASKSEVERIEIKKVMYAKAVDNIAARDRDAKLKKMENDASYVETYRKWLQEPNPVVKAQLGKQLVQFADSVADIDRVLKAPESGGDPLLFSNLRDDIENGLITDYRQVQKFVRPGGIDAGQLDRLQSAIMAQDKDQIKAVRNKIKDESGIGLIQGTFDPKESRFVKKNALESRFDRLLQQEKEKNRLLPPDKVMPIDYDGLYAKALEDYKKTDEANQIKANAVNNLKRFEALALTKKKLEVKITADTSIEDLRRLKVYSDDELNFIDKQIKILRDNQTK